MGWISFARIHGGDAIAGVPGTALRRIAEAIDEQRDIVDVARGELSRPDGMPPSVLQRLWDIEARRKRWWAAAERLAEARRAEGLGPLPDALVAQMGTPDAVAALDRAARLHPSATALDLREMVAAWEDCFALAQRDGEVRVDRAVEDEERLAPYADLLQRRDAPAGIPAYRWLALRRGDREGVLVCRLVFPLEAFAFRWKASLPRLAAIGSGGPDPDEAFRCLVLDPLPDALLRHLDEKAEAEALASAAGTYASLFRAPPLKVSRVVAVFFGRGPRPVSWVLTDGAGALLEGAVEAATGDDWAKELLESWQERSAEALVLPASSPAVDRLRQIESAAHGRLAITRVPTAAVREGKEALGEEAASLPSGQAAALVLARRALDPVTHFGAVDPSALGLAEYQHDLDPTRVRKHLLAARALAEVEAERLAAARASASPASAAGSGPDAGTGRPGAPDAAGKPLLPPTTVVTSFQDLKPGMMILGTVTSVTQFGAFINIGLRQEGLLHVSEMGERRVQDPSEVVRPGQQVRVRVIEVDRARNRVSLSMRPTDARGPRPGGPSGRVRSAALRELDKLFKK